jgi:hypothetical protein
VSLAADSFNGGRTGPARGLGAEERASRTLKLAFATFADRAEVIAGWAEFEDEVCNHQVLASRRLAVISHANGLALVRKQGADLLLAKQSKVPHQRQQLVFAIPVSLSQSAALAFVEVYAACNPPVFANQQAIEAVTVCQPEAREDSPPSLSGLFRKWLGAPSPQSTAPDTPAILGLDCTQQLASLGASLEEVRKVYEYTSPRMSYVQHAVVLCERPEPPGATPLPEADQKTRALVVQLSILLGGSQPVFQRCQVALGQTTALRRELLRAELAWQRLAKVPPQEFAEAAHLVEIGSLRGKAVPLANFPRTFQGDPILRQLFPPAVRSPATTARF